ncbi:MAG TPA: PilZ domain-containing protein [Terriglobales bacterium]|nr:PilZ domain-containing protein [Terriglobales bacterium]
MLAQLHNISLSGSYVHTPQSLAEHTRVRVIVQTGSCKADLWGVIRRQDQDGLGIQFTNGTTVEDWKSLEAIIEQLEARRAVTTAAKHSSATVADRHSNRQNSAYRSGCQL